MNELAAITKDEVEVGLGEVVLDFDCAPDVLILLRLGSFLDPVSEMI